MSTCYVIDLDGDWEGEAGVLLIGDGGFGVLAETIPSTGSDGPPYAYPDLSFPSDTGVEICGKITAFPTHGTMVANDDTSFIYTATSSGVDSFTYQLYRDGVASGAPVVIPLNANTISGAATATVTMTGTLNAATSAAIAGAASGNATMVGALNNAVSGSAAGNASMTGQLSGTISGHASGVGSGSGTLTPTGASIYGAATGNATGSGTLDHSGAPIAGGASGAASAAGTLVGTSVPIGGEATAETAVTGQLGVKLIPHPTKWRIYANGNNTVH